MCKTIPTTERTYGVGDIDYIIIHSIYSHPHLYQITKKTI